MVMPYIDINRCDSGKQGIRQFVVIWTVKIMVMPYIDINGDMATTIQCKTRRKCKMLCWVNSFDMP